MKREMKVIVFALLVALIFCGSASADTATGNDTTNYTVNDTNYTTSGTGTDSSDSGSDCLPTIAHGTIQGEVYISSTAGWPGSNPDNFNVPNGTVVFARYYTGVWMGTASTTFNGYDVPINASYASGMGVTWIAYDVTDYVIPGALNTANSYSSGGDGRQYGNTLVVVLQNENDPTIEYWITEGLDWLNKDGMDYSNTTLEGTVNISDVQNASLYSVHLTGYNYEDMNGYTLPSPTEHVSGGYFDALRWDNLQGLLVAENQSVNVGRGSDEYTSLVFHALTITYKAADLVPTSLTPAAAVPNISNTLIATIENQGAKGATTFNVSLSVDGTVVDTKSVASLASGSSTTVDFHWTPDGTKDSYNLTVSVDPENTIDELEENNNNLDVLVGTTTATAPVADFTADTTSGDEPLIVSFIDQSSNSPTSWLWDFGDGTTSSEQNPTYNYTIPGTYTVKLTATNAGGSDIEEKTDYITVNAITPVASFTTNTTSGVIPLTVQFTDTSIHYPTEWFWDFGDGINSTLQNPTHTYTTAGKYTVTLTATNAGGNNTKTQTNYITAYATPVANFTASSTNGSAPFTVTFTDQSSNIPTSWFWNFGDGTTSTAHNPTHTYSNLGTYTVTLTTTNPAGSNSTTKTGYITVTIRPAGPIWAANSSWNVFSWNDRSAPDYPSPAFADLDGDGDYDLLIGMRTPGTAITLAYENTGNTTNPVWVRKSEWDAANVNERSNPVLADLDDDGDYDLLIGEYRGNTYAYENIGNKTNPIWAGKSEWNAPDIGWRAKPSLADLDGDGDYDLLIGDSKGVTYAYENTGTATSPVWTRKSEWDLPDIGSDASPALADLDGDGDYDLLISVTSGVYGYENTGNTTNPVWTRTSLWDAPNPLGFPKPCLVDLDGDGDYDLLLGSRNGGGSKGVYGYENTALVGASPDLTPTSVNLPSSINVDNPCNVSAVVSNTGMVDVGAFVATLSVDGIVVDTQSVLGPAAGSSSTVNFNWTPTTMGDHTLTVIVDPENGIDEPDETNNTLSVDATVKMALPVVDFAVDDTNVTTVDSVHFTDQTTNSPTSWFWDFGDGYSSTLQNPTHTYTTPGTYTVKLTATNDGGSANVEKTDYITVVYPYDLTVTDVNPQQATVFAGETNNVTITVVNNGADSATNIVVNLYASDVDGGTTNVATTTIASLEAGASTTVTLVDPTIRPITADTIYGSSSVSYVTYTACVDPDDSIPESNETNNLLVSELRPVYYNGYKGKRYGYNGEDATSSDTNTAGDISTRHVYDIVGDVIYSSGTSAYHGVGWTSSISTWTTSDLSVPSTATVLDALLYVAYNWDTTSDGNPNWTITFNGVDINPIALYTDQKNFGGSWALYKYGLLVYNVTSLYKVTGDNTLNITALTGNSNALYPSTMVVVYSDPNSTRKQIFINEECDELLYGTDYGLTLDEVTAYAPFTGLTIDTSNVINATIHSFAGSAGANEGNLIWNDTLLAGNAWQGDSYSASALVFDVKNYLNSMGNVVGVQGTSNGGMVALQQILVVEYAPDLVVTNLTVNPNNGDNWFANEPNIINVTVTNQGGSASPASTVTVDINGSTYTVDVPALEVGDSATVTVTDNTSRTAGDTVPVSANTDPTDNIPETNEANNLVTTTFTVCNNGYKGKQYTDDDEHDSQETQQTFTGTYDVVYSSGNTSYAGSDWTEQTYTWTASDLSIPAGATVVSARLYQMYAYNKMGVDPAWILRFNGNTQSTIATYSDIKGWGSYNYPYGLYVYDVTSFFNTAGNSMTITPEADNKYSLYGAYLIVVYQDSNTTNKTIWINDGFDMLCSKSSFSVNDTEATSYANYDNVDISKVTNAQVIAILAGADKDGQSKFFFNGQEYTGFWNDYKGSTGEPQTGFSVYDVTSALQSGTNTAAMQSYDSGSGGDNMYTLTSILVTTLDTTPPEVTADVDSGTYDSVQSVTLTATDDQDTSPDIYYTTDGTTPTTSSTPYTGSITVDRAMTLSFMAVDDKGNLSHVQTKTYNIQSDVYLEVTPSNIAPVVGDTVTYTFKLGNRGPGVATDVVFTYQIPEGMEYVGVIIDKGENSDAGVVNYDPATRTITWTFDELDVCDPWLWLDLRVSSSGTYLVQPTLVTGNYNPSLTSNIGSTVINAILKSVSTPQAATTAATVASAATTTVQSGTVPMQTTGIPLAGLLLAILCVGSGLVINRKK